MRCGTKSTARRRSTTRGSCKPRKRPAPPARAASPWSATATAPARPPIVDEAGPYPPGQPPPPTSVAAATDARHRRCCRPPARS
eukprot:4761930-Prymnesium_polylepis.1